MNYAELWVNGQPVKTRHGGYLPIVVDITDMVNPGGKNVLAVRLDNRDNPVTGPKPLKILDFNTYGGLYREASLTFKNDVRISHPVLADKVASGGIFITTPVVSEKESQVRVQTHVTSSSGQGLPVEVKHAILYQGQVVADAVISVSELGAGQDSELIANLSVENAKLWSPQEPNLYLLKTTLLAGGEEVDQAETRFGIREFKFVGTDLHINGKQTYLRGVNRHQEYPFIGYALSDNAQYRDAKKIKEAGFDFIRLSHYPHSPAFMHACDELGLVVIDAILGWQFFQDTEEFRNYCYRSARELIRRDRNHPCVLLWEVSLNETQMPMPFMQQLHDIVDEEIPDDSAYSGGWKPEVYDSFFQARQHKIMHGYHPEIGKPYMVSEYGDWEYYSNNAGLNQHGFDKLMRLEKSSRQLRSFGEKRLLQQAYNLQEAYNDNLTTMAFGDGYWVMFDYNRGYHDELEASGIMDIFRLPKFSYDFYRSQQDPDQYVTTKLATYWTAESPLNVKVFSNTEKVRLYLNDKLVAEQGPDTDKNSSHLPHPPFTFNLKQFEPGTLKAVGMTGGNEVSQHVVRTPSAPVTLDLRLDESGKAAQAGVNDTLFLYISAVDQNGTVVPDFDEVVSVELPAGIELLNVGPVLAEAGIATALIRIGDQTGSVEVKASTEGLTDGSLIINIGK